MCHCNEFCFSAVLLVLTFSVCSLTSTKFVLCNANVLLILHLLPSVTSPTYQSAFKAVQKEVSVVSRFHFAPQGT